MNITDFFANEYVNQASYDNLRKIASLVDGQKNGARKVLHTILSKNIREKTKVQQLGSLVAGFSEYLHGNLSGVIVNLAQDFVGTNNVPLLVKSGNFGTRFSPEASADRYIYTFGSPELFNLFKKEDNAVLKQQMFEGTRIEPVFFVPSLPVILLNGSEGVSSGFAQKILPRNPKKIKKYIADRLAGTYKPLKANSLEPFYEGFTGEIVQGDNPSQWIIKGVAKKISFNKVEITEVPVGHTLRSYLDVLDDLEEKKVINSYTDKSENDKFHFVVTLPSKVLAEWSDEDILDNLKLKTKVSENFTAMDENNKIVVYDSAEEIIEHYIRVKLDYVQRRKDWFLKNIKESITYDMSRYKFIEGIVNGAISVQKRTKDEIILDIKKIQGIIEKDGSFDYLLNMPIYSLTTERLKKLKDEMKEKKAQEQEMLAKTPETLWLEDIT